MTDFDFGFDSEHENSVDNPTDPTTDIAKERQKVMRLYDAIIPLLNNLARHPDKPIVWPNRDKKIEEFKLQLKEIVES